MIHDMYDSRIDNRKNTVCFLCVLAMYFITNDLFELDLYLSFFSIFTA